MKSLAILLLAVVLVSVIPRHSLAQQVSVNISNPDIIHRYLSAATHSDFELMKQYLHPNKLSYHPILPDTVNYKNAIKRWKKNSSILTNIEYIILFETAQTIREGPLKGEWVMVWGFVKAYHIPGKRWIEFQDHIVAKLEAHKIVYIHEFYDPNEYLSRLGYEIKLIQPTVSASRSSSTN